MTSAANGVPNSAEGTNGHHNPNPRYRSKIVKKEKAKDVITAQNFNCCGISLTPKDAKVVKAVAVTFYGLLLAGSVYSIFSKVVVLGVVISVKVATVASGVLVVGAIVFIVKQCCCAQKKPKKSIRFSEEPAQLSSSSNQKGSHKVLHRVSRSGLSSNDIRNKLPVDGNSSPTGSPPQLGRQTLRVVRVSSDTARIVLDQASNFNSLISEYIRLYNGFKNNANDANLLGQLKTAMKNLQNFVETALIDTLISSTFKMLTKTAFGNGTEQLEMFEKITDSEGAPASKILMTLMYRIGHRFFDHARSLPKESELLSRTFYIEAARWFHVPARASHREASVCLSYILCSRKIKGKSTDETDKLFSEILPAAKKSNTGTALELFEMIPLMDESVQNKKAKECLAEIERIEEDEREAAREAGDVKS